MNSKKDFVIALDGPSASGKSTLGERLANSLNFIYLDTGVMYRAVTLAVLNMGVDVSDEDAVSRIAEKLDLDVRPPSIADGRSNDIILNDDDVTWTIRTAEVEKNVSQVSAYSRVRQAMTRIQRRIGKRGNVVMVGRDIGTVVLPDAEIKLYLDASAEERARRRFLELRKRGKDVEYKDILQDMIKRDQFDSSRPIAPLKPAEDAIIINSDDMNADEVFQRIMGLLNEFHKD
ncbi:MAG: cytidylate kinase [Chloroflexi bacterium HGW-Chloroflexi-8]|nr:MAG: cytidylate kinase [Chloroflexi bacterium HGW-Chloroflexi-8]